MTLLYRAIWNDDRKNLLDSVTSVFESWLGSKGIDTRLPDEGFREGEVRDGRFQLTIRRAIAGPKSAVRVELDEDRSTGERWSTTLVAIDDREGANWVWIDLERVAANTTTRPSVVAPRLARELIETGVDPRVDHVRLTTRSLPIEPRGLAGLIRNVNRSLPIIVFSEAPVEGPTPLIRRADAVARRLAGAAEVAYLPRHQIDEFKELIGPALAVWGGAARIYLPNTGPEGLRPERHRYVALEQMGSGIERVGSIVASLVGGAVTARRPPVAYSEVERELKLGRTQSDREELAVAWDEVASLTKERDELRAELERLNDDLFDMQADYDEAVHEHARVSLALRSRRFGDEGDVASGAFELGVEVSSLEEAIAVARGSLDHLAIHDAAPTDIERLDGSVTGKAWGNMLWRGLRALHLYAGSEFDGDFRRWCSESGDEWAWNPSDKHLAMRESESVETNSRLRSQRLFPVATEVEPSGRILMWAHLKIAQGGGPLAPRVYFHDDTRGATGKVHVGFIGPHEYTENTKTN